MAGRNPYTGLGLPASYWDDPQGVDSLIGALYRSAAVADNNPKGRRPTWYVAYKGRSLPLLQHKTGAEAARDFRSIASGYEQQKSDGPVAGASGAGGAGPAGATNSLSRQPGGPKQEITTGLSDARGVGAAAESDFQGINSRAAKTRVGPLQAVDAQNVEGIALLGALSPRPGLIKLWPDRDGVTAARTRVRAIAGADFTADTDYFIITTLAAATHAFWFDTTGGDTIPAGANAAANKYRIHVSGTGTATIQCLGVGDMTADTDYILFTKPNGDTHAFWFDVTGSDSEPAGSQSADDSTRVNIAGLAAAEDAAQQLLGAINTELGSGGTGELEDAISNGAGLLTVSSVFGGANWALAEFVTNAGFLVATFTLDAEVTAEDVAALIDAALTTASISGITPDHTPGNSYVDIAVDATGSAGNGWTMGDFVTDPDFEAHDFNGGTDDINGNFGGRSINALPPDFRGDACMACLLTYDQGTGFDDPLSTGQTNQQQNRVLELEALWNVQRDIRGVRPTIAVVSNTGGTLTFTVVMPEAYRRDVAALAAPRTGRRVESVTHKTVAWSAQYYPQDPDDFTDTPDAQYVQSHDRVADTGVSETHAITGLTNGQQVYVSIWYMNDLGQSLPALLNVTAVA
jgi:hypothetical protein